MITFREPRTRCLWILCACAIGISGCETRRAPAKPVVNFIAAVHPTVPPSADGELESPPDLPAQEPAEPPQLGLAHSQPVRPRVAVPVAQEPVETGKHVTPTIVPEVATEELRTAQAETQRSLDAAEKNLMIAQGRKLNATQTDLVSKVRGFADNAREAIRNGDWVRAKNFSSKAQVLSEQLAASF